VSSGNSDCCTGRKVIGMSMTQVSTVVQSGDIGPAALKCLVSTSRWATRVGAGDQVRRRRAAACALGRTLTDILAEGSRVAEALHDADT
jgi:hypothetical protein